MLWNVTFGNEKRNPFAAKVEIRSVLGIFIAHIVKAHTIGLLIEQRMRISVFTSDHVFQVSKELGAE